MRYPFPADLTLEEVRDVIRDANARIGAPAFVEGDRGGFLIFNYAVQMPGSFVDPDKQPTETLARQAAIIRECRGLCFDKRSGEVIRRPYHKFFNVNERPETLANAIDWTADHHVLDKVDGSIITPMIIGGDCVWHIKEGWPGRGIPEFVADKRAYVSFANDCAAIGVTPIFEWCSPQRRIVVPYAEDNLILTGIRNNRTGAYTPYEAMVGLAESYGLPVVRSFGRVTDLDTYLDEVRALVGAEGHVIRFADGHQVKTKGQWYLAIHKTKDALVFEKDVFSLALSPHKDDIKAQFDDLDRAAVEAFEERLFEGMAKTGRRLAVLAVQGREIAGTDNARFAHWVTKESGAVDLERGIIFDIDKGKDPATAVREVVAKYVGDKNRLERVRFLTDGARWHRNGPFDA